LTSNANLLRLLEPAVRPGGSPNLATPPAVGEAPFEAQDFDALLASARTQNPQDTAVQETSSPALTPTDTATTTDVATAAAAVQPARILNALSGVANIENPGLREMLAARATTNQHAA